MITTEKKGEPLRPSDRHLPLSILLSSGKALFLVSPGDVPVPGRILARHDSGKKQQDFMNICVHVEWSLPKCAKKAGACDTCVKREVDLTSSNIPLVTSTTAGSSKEVEGNFFNLIPKAPESTSKETKNFFLVRSPAKWSNTAKKAERMKGLVRPRIELLIHRRFRVLPQDFKNHIYSKRSTKPFIWRQKPGLPKPKVTNYFICFSFCLQSTNTMDIGQPY